MKRTSTFIVMLCIIGMARMANAQEVKINTGLAVETDGTLRMDGDATVWEDLRVPFNFGTSNTLATTWMQLTGVLYLDAFRPAGDDALYFSVQLPHSWKAGTNIFPHIHWTPMDAGTVGNNGVYWELEYVWANKDETFATSPSLIFGYLPIGLSGDLVENRHYITKLDGDGEVDGINGSGKTISSMLICRIARRGGNALDTYTGNAGAMECDFHYQLDTFGSRGEYTK